MVVRAESLVPVPKEILRDRDSFTHKNSVDHGFGFSSVRSWFPSHCEMAQSAK
jgi:hypothetical protein